MRKLTLAAPIMLAACALTGNATNDIANFQAAVKADTSDFNTKLAAFNANAVQNAVVVGKAACGLSNQLHGVFVGPLGQVAVEVGTTAAGAAGTAPAIDAMETVVFADVQKNCAIIDAADPSNPTAVELTAVQTLIADVPQLQRAVAKVSPTAAALLAPAAPAVSPGA